jgi:preprotein translocase subunit SecD
MQGNGVRIAITLGLLVLCGFYLFPTAQNYYYSQQLDNLEGEARSEYKNEHRQAIQKARSQSLKLGLDLRGGMSVTLEVQVAQFLSELAEDQDDSFNQALQTARQRAQASGGEDSIINLFIQAFEQQNPNARLARYFRSQTAGIDRRSDNEAVAEYLRTQADQAVGRAIDIVRRRVNQYGVAEPSIQRQGTRRIVVEMPGIENAERIRELLRGTARLEFRLMGGPQQLADAMKQIRAYYENYRGPGADTLLGSPEPGTTLPSEGAPADTGTAPGAGDTTAAGKGQGTRLGQGAAPPSQQQSPQQQGGTQLSQQQQAPGPDTAGTQLGNGDGRTPSNPLAARMNILPRGAGVMIGTVAASDTAAVNALMSRPEVRQMLPDNVTLMYSASPFGQNPQGEKMYRLLGVRAAAEMTGEVVDEASVTFDQYTNEPKVSITMDSKGAREWSRLTAANINKQVAIVLDRAVVSNPVIQERIPGGRTSISGLENRQEAEDIVTVLNAGALPAPVEIVSERTVGPSLGQESIQAGLTSVLVGLLIVALFMIFYYRTGGVVADLALFLNLILILGILAGFNATLTLPGIAGIVLTIGMAVDANVLIFDRIREEQRAGKTLVAAIEAGYQRALSAILDANITTFFVGAILYSFGVGPVRGFAVTLMAGILSSMFTAIIVTRVVFDYLVKERGRKVSYG